jgi:integrase family protein with SAM-like domain
MSVYLNNVAATRAHKTWLAYSLTLAEFRKSCTRGYVEQIDKCDLTAYVVALKKDEQDDRTIANRVANVVTFLRAIATFTEFGAPFLIELLWKSWAGSQPLGAYSPCQSVIQVNSNGEELRPEEAHCPRVPCAAWQFTRQPALAFAWIVVGQQVRRARVPVVSQPLTQFQPYMRIAVNVADVSRFRSMLCH